MDPPTPKNTSTHPRASHTRTTPTTSTTTTPLPCLGRLIRQKFDVGRIRTYAPEGTRFLVLRDNHSATTPKVNCTDVHTRKQTLIALCQNRTSDLIICNPGLPL
ncbi:uncharacterized protein M421DRAFT_415630 [Didymella exigua CBS 183.55]|uniref:Uncharacterized protein n=1 Tax=Didymella exigua CBS 183.55 TaxID=1150837 RepID=A0A6A5S486_9PLEO|nr:uncharacterized protein M421DRAFT_415630 [Didymella exigua CBS 183.55]KAF1933286.1 hypothetical protein M421DRAFT_415630 [Didymella exigua CBS 183.55]